MAEREKKMNNLMIYKAVSDMINENYSWLSDEKNKDKAVQYILGLNDMARHLVELPYDLDTERREE